jgi:copper chaperone NosL
MRKESRWMVALAAVLLAPAFALPLWSIRIVAPQYREGLGMFIGLRDIWGHQPHDIQNINILNHYIGMKAIDPAIVDVLTIMPWVVAFLMASALVVALIGKRTLVAGWLVAFVGLGTAGLVEFYRWNHDYGTNLDPMAPIKIPGMSYQPPIFGTKQLLNMSTSSYPSWGTLFIALAFLAGVLALVNEFRPLFGGRAGESGRSGSTRAPRGSGPRLRRAAAVALLAVAGGVAGCAPEGARDAEARDLVPEFAADLPPCDYCEGFVPETRYGAQLVTRDGTVHRFMGIECMAGFLLEERVPASEVARLQVVDFNHGERLLDAESARYIRMDFERSPGGLNLAAVETERVAGTLHYFLGGERMGWDEVLEYVRGEWGL